MQQKRLPSIALGLVLILLGLFFLVAQAIPEVRRWLDIDNSWPLIIVGNGLALLVIGLAIGVLEMAIPACIVGGIGGLLFWQNATGDWESWSYVWTLIPGFVGVGILLAGFLRGGSRSMGQGGMNLIVISLVLFAVFGTFFGALDSMGVIWPILLIAAGGLLVAWSALRNQ
ncbi:MAG: hypothetical protein A2Z21_04335 [Candidatus Fraserbacteria bacterium RBG_16_55_9]|uniref:DUF5668 domain-containing protein n=1 Tax=Fraserbacteria sp. (strain RBG_16_55_9) TaxID=1817864 RepID=A0A1F5UNX9_FRAXR|nr:MAG: hypothetical protein A2Z21_04335 [Candidatus Fraserbacteria bacterium RBG_16_55_9]